MAKRTLEQRYWSHIDVRGPDECWPWTGGTSRGYGKFYDGVGMRRAHRVGWQIVHGAWPGELHVLHSCDNPLCQNPTHWRLGTHADNMHEMYERKRHRQIRGEEVKNSRLTEQSVREIRALRREGHTLVELGARFGVHFSTIAYACNGKNWSHID